MELKKFAGADKSELSLIEVAHEILKENGEPMAFADLTNAMQDYLGKSDQEIRNRLPQFYADLNVDGGFISLGENMWGLRAWYPYDSIDEALVHGEDEDASAKKRPRVNALANTTDEDDDVVAFNSSADLNKAFTTNVTDYDEDDEENQTVDDGLEDGIEGQLSAINPEDE
ncbi:DNA-directed RNA polymerase subunit delta [Ligilactobacillus sp. LYQ60]|uniref:DNA-directed RNA polymerase subunit delta n=1 Tax=Ligilactobacillus sp. LYQ60 TaxID=3378799 RepID=UPI0038554EFB